MTTSQVSVRTARPGDAAALVAHLKELAAEPGINIPLAADEVTLSTDDERELIEDLNDNDRATMLVAIGDDEIVGELTIRGVSPRRAVRHVATLGMSVKATWRRRGVGRALMDAAIEWAKAAGFTRLELNVYARNEAAIKLYEGCGFQIEGKRRNFIREGDTYLDDLVMGRVE